MPQGYRITLVAAAAVAAIASAAPAQAAAPDVTKAPVRTAHTHLGRVGYRILGTGSPLVLITGFSASIDNWAPTFVNALAAHHRVVLLDNAGVGTTAIPRRGLSIVSMADQTSALIATLRLGRTAVLGWSLGGMVAQALAVRHPGQVSRLVLAATQAGNGKSLPIPPAAAAEAASTNPAVVLSVLFPTDQTAAARAYVDGIATYPHYYQAPAAIKPRQTATLQRWLRGAYRAGRELARVRVPALVADGTEDQLDSVANDRLLARAIHHAKLLLYPDAGHAFLFQDASRFAAAVNRFLR